MKVYVVECEDLGDGWIKAFSTKAKAIICVDEAVAEWGREGFETAANDADEPFAKPEGKTFAEVYGIVYRRLALPLGTGQGFFVHELEVDAA